MNPQGGWPQQQGGVMAPPPQATGVPQMPMGQQQMGQMPSFGYDTSQLPRAPQNQQQQQQGGVMGTPVQQPLMPQMPQQGGQQQYFQQPQPQQGTPLPQPHQQPQQQPQQGQPQSLQLDDNVRLDGPSVPPELRGRTWGDVKRLYGALSTDWLRRSGQPRNAQGQFQGQQQEQQPQQPQGQQPPQGQPQGSFWQNPEQRVAEVVRQQLEPLLQPMMQQSQMQAVQQARQIAAQSISDFQQLEPEIMQMVAGASPQDLQNPQVWQAAADIVRGRRAALGQQQPQGQQPSQQFQGQRQGPTSVPSYQAPPVHSFFSEGPTAPSNGQFSGQPQTRQPTQTDVDFANRFQMPLNDYMAWKYGVGQQQGGGF